jgi:hypothetical protein
MIQIDGLSQKEFDKALKQGELPFLQRIKRCEHYQTHQLYSGLPATTPAFQGELFYGVKGAVPAFSFKDRKSQKIVRMYQSDAAAHVEKRLTRGDNEPLVRGGSAYSDIFTGGADEAHFCPSSLGWGPALRFANPLVVVLLAVINFYSFLRIGALLLLEFALAAVDLTRGLVRGYDFLKELKFVPTRVAICILLRELIVIGARIDIGRGLPVVHVNFIGYDEQAHRRGPDSLFAHWTLKGIDDAVARLWHAAGCSARRDYDLWIYSDHGQTSSHPYEKLFDRSLTHAVNAIYEKLDMRNRAADEKIPASIQTQRVSFLGGRRFQRLFSMIDGGAGQADDAGVSVAALGTLGFIYPPRPLNKDETDFIARELVTTANVPLVITVDETNPLCARTNEGVYKLPAQMAELFGAEHPFLEEISRDLIRLCRHKEAGEFILLGWCRGLDSISFAIENGSHAGASPQETNAFALLPEDTLLPETKRDYIRPIDLRNAALLLLGRKEQGVKKAPDHPLLR